MRLQAIIALASIVLAPAARAAEVSRYGSFQVSVEKDRFGGNDTAVAMVMNGTDAFAVRCLQGGLSFAYMQGGFGQGRWEEGMEGDVKMRVDQGPIVDLGANGVNDKVLQITAGEDVARSLVGAKEVALRVDIRGIRFDRVFTLRQSAKAVPVVLRACAANATPAPPAQAVEPAAPPVAAPPPAEAAGTDTALSKTILHDGLDDMDRAAIDKVAPIYIASARCNYMLHPTPVAAAIAAATRSDLVFTAASMAEALNALVAAQLAAVQSPAAASADTTAFCAKALAEYGKDGSIVKGALGNAD